MSSQQNILEIKDLYASVKIEDEEQQEILKGINLTIKPGETHVLMGLNGSGKSTLANTLMGHPNYVINSGDAIFRGESILKMNPEDKARKGMFLAFQYPTEIPGLSVISFLRSIMKAVSQKDVSFREFKKELTNVMSDLNIPESFLTRSLNDGFSGGEKKRMEILQQSLLKPKLSILDETDSGLDVDAMKLVFESLSKNQSEDQSFLIITHYSKILRYIHPDHVHIMIDGKIVKSGGIELSDMIEDKGFEAVLNS